MFIMPNHFMLITAVTLGFFEGIQDAVKERISTPWKKFLFSCVLSLIEIYIIYYAAMHIVK